MGHEGDGGRAKLGAGDGGEEGQNCRINAHFLRSVTRGRGKGVELNYGPRLGK